MNIFQGSISLLKRLPQSFSASNPLYLLFLISSTCWRYPSWAYENAFNSWLHLNSELSLNLTMTNIFYCLGVRNFWRINWTSRKEIHKKEKNIPVTIPPRRIDPKPWIVKVFVIEVSTLITKSVFVNKSAKNKVNEGTIIHFSLPW